MYNLYFIEVSTLQFFAWVVSCNSFYLVKNNLIRSFVLLRKQNKMDPISTEVKDS